jgi:hypothetical protein
MTESDAPPKTRFAPRPRNEIEKARSRPEAREFSLLTNRAVEVDGARHVVGRGGDGADTLDHCGHAPLRMRHRAYDKPGSVPSS